MSPDEQTEVIAVLRASKGRQILGVMALGGLGLILIYMAATQQMGLGLQAVLIGLGVLVLWMADAMRRATNSAVELTQNELRDADGTVIARLSEIGLLDRGFFAFKPSNGFLLKTRQSSPVGWRPGLWWRIGRRVGVGGMTSAGQAKMMSEIIASLIAERGA